MKKFKCLVCGSTNVQIQAWINPNTKEYIESCGDDEGWREGCNITSVCKMKDDVVLTKEDMQ